MRRRGGWLTGIAIAVLAAPGLADGDRRAASDFHRRAIVAGEFTPGEAYAVALASPAVAALDDGGELRLFDGDGREIPSLVHSAFAREVVVDNPISTFDQTWDEDGTRTLSVELTDRKVPPVNEFVFDLADEEFNLRVRIEASTDGESWRILRDGLHLIRHAVEREKIDYVHNVLRVPNSRFRYYRFTLRPTTPYARPADTAREPLEVDGIAVRRVARRGSVLSLPVTLERFEDDRDDDTRHHYWKLDLGRENLGVDQLSFTIPGKDFARSASLWEWSPERGRRTRALANTVAFHYDDEVHTEFTGFSTDARVLVMRIDQGDDEPVEVIAASASRPKQQLRFLGPAAVEPPLALYFDPDDARAPRYDFARKLREHEVTKFTALTHGPLEPNPSYTPPPEPRSERIPYLLYALVVPLIAGLVWYIARTIGRGVPPEGPPPAD